MDEYIEDMDALIQSFMDRASASTGVSKLVKGWDRTLEINVIGESPPTSYFITCRSGSFERAPGLDARADIVVSAERDCLLDMLNGELNPMRAHVEGLLQYSGNAQDELVVDSILMLIWGY